MAARRLLIAISLLLATATATTPAPAATPVPGVTATEIKVGQTAPFSGPASAYGKIATAEAGYIRMINEQGGVNGRKINLLQMDDSYSPPKTVEDTRKLVEQDEVAIMFQTIGTAPNTAIRKYLNRKHVPDIWLGSGASMFVDPKNYPWSIPFQPNYRVEGQMYGKYILKVKPDAKLGILYQNDDLGRDYVAGIRAALGDRADKLILKTLSYEITDPTVDSQIIALQQAGCDVLVEATTPKFAALAIRKVADLGWHPLQIVDSNGSTVKPVLQSVGFERAKGIITAFYLKDPTDPQWQDDAGVKAFFAWQVKYAPGNEVADASTWYGYNMAQALVYVLQKAGNDLSRENILKQATNMHDVTFSLLIPGVTVSTSPTDYRPLKTMQLERFDGKRYVLLPQ
ncbi:MAG: ABC transporter substrate-binding protein [Pseudomonadota bacterium]|nr:ABC transporter substrate-binding protein [Pseudomonadota bacterium]MDQ2803976.1 ABC transporter substrate-binding protein [Pseudomonadota bacterium]